jgi:hypothetical protein
MPERPTPVAVQSKAWVCDCLLVWIECLNPRHRFLSLVTVVCCQVDASVLG